MYATVAEIKVILPAGVISDDDIQDLLDLAAVDTGDDHKYHLNKTLSLAVAKLKLNGLLPDSATVGPLKADNNVSKAIDAISGSDTQNRIPFLYYKKVGNSETE